ncbi:MAG: hypothetical protein U5O15_09795 [Candidatus Krumholzibacteriota bacterium]|nr:hypothetical protein [Candidatus Krumholzibacteriota bacterium]
MKKLLVLFSVLVIALYAMPANADDCVDVELGAEVVESETIDILQLYFSLENCGTEPGMVELTVELTYDSEEVGTGTFEVYMPAGEIVVKELELPIPEAVPPGEYALCVTAEMGFASDVACATVYLNDDNMVTSFNTVSSPVGTEEATWGKVKSIHR